MVEMTYHCKIQRASRVEHIIHDIGLGQVVKEQYIRTTKMVQAGEPGRYLCITDTGITIIKSEDKLKIITMYVTTQAELIHAFGGMKKIPPFLRKRVDRNQSKYTNNGKTIWV